MRPFAPPPRFAEMVAASNFSFLRGASPAEDLVATALALGHGGIGIADRNTVAGVVRVHRALLDLREAGDETVAAAAKAFKLVAGARLVFADGAPDVVVHPTTRDGWGRLCRLLTLGKRRAAKGACTLGLDDLIESFAIAPADLALIVMPDPAASDAVAAALARLAAVSRAEVRLAAAMPRGGADRRRLSGLIETARAAGVALIATNDALYAAPQDRDVQDVLSAIRERVPLAAMGRRLEANAERHLKAEAEMRRLFADAPGAVDEAGRLLASIRFDLGDLTYEYPDEPVPEGWTAQAWLEDLTRRRAAERWPAGVPEKVAASLDSELRLIGELDYARYFLTVHDIVAFARSRGILCQGRGSAANSAVCYALGITCVDPAENDLLFARFISAERREPPDIDVDFEHERREEVIQHVYEKYGRHRAGLVATVISYRPRSAIRDVGKAFGLSEDVIRRLAGVLRDGRGGISAERARQAGFNPDNPTIARVLTIAARILGFPRHLSQHVGGFVLARGRLDETVAIGNAAMDDRTFIEWDKDDIDTLRLMKVDVLALGMLTCIRKAFDLLRLSGGPDLGLADVPLEDPEVWAMLGRADTIGVFQIESRAQMNMLPHLAPKCFYDLVIEVAIVRPGPIQGGMVHPYLRRRAGLEDVVFPSPSPEHGPPDELHGVLGKTLGVPLFQEQAMKLAMVAAKFTDAEANRLRRAMATFRNIGTIQTFETMMVGRMVARGYDPAFAQACFEQIKGFGSYGFPESHAASFAKLVWISGWLKCRHPAVFACALLNSQPMGFYAPAQIVRDARDHGVPVGAVDVARSTYDNRLGARPDGTIALRLGFRQVDGLSQDAAERIVAARGAGFLSVEDLARRARLDQRSLRLLADADAFRSMGLDRRAAAWAIRRLPDAAPLPLFAAMGAPELAAEPAIALPEMGLAEQVVADYQTVRLSLKAHPMALLRDRFAAEGVLTAADLAAARDGTWAKAAGVVLVRQRPGNGKAIFVTLEDETGVANALLWAREFERFRAQVVGARLMLIEGVVQKSHKGVVHLMGRRVEDRTALLDGLALDDGSETDPTGNAARHPRDVRVLPKSRDFH